MELKEALEAVSGYIEDPCKGLPEEVFLFASAITPMVNVDLLIRDDRGRYLLSWREDEYCGSGWHIPGGIIRLKETLEERLIKTALSEIGCRVSYRREPLGVEELIHPHAVRGHFLSFLYECRVPEGYRIDNSGHGKGEAGYLAWHESFPEDMIEVHHIYRKYFDSNTEGTDGIN